MLTKQETLLGRASGWRAVGKGAQENCSARGCSLGFYGDGISFPVVFGQSL